MQTNTFHLTTFQNPSGQTVFRVDGKSASGKRVRQNFRTEAEALAAKQAFENEILNTPSVPLRATRLSESHVAEAEAAFRELNGKSLTVAVRFYLDNFKEPKTSYPVEKAWAEFIADKRGQNLRELTIRSLEIKCLGLLDRYRGRNVSDITADGLKELIHTPGRSPVTRNNVRRAFSGFLKWATEKEYCGANPLSTIKPAKTERPDPQILPLDKVKALLQGAADYKDGVCLPYVVLGLFGAIRPQEIAKLSWKNLDLTKGTVTITSEIAKMRGKRIVHISQNACEWLRPFLLKRPHFVGKNWRRDFDAVKLAAGYGTPTKDRPDLKEWTPDILRHTAISYHLAKCQHEGETARWGGNSPDIIVRHYLGLVSDDDAKEFWNIFPKTAESNILKMA